MRHAIVDHRSQNVAVTMFHRPKRKRSSGGAQLLFRRCADAHPPEDERFIYILQLNTNEKI